MGTLFKQEPRNYHKTNLDAFLSDANELARKHKMTVADVFVAKAALELERRNDLIVANGDIHDEQMSGIGDLLQQLASAVESLQPE